MKSFYPKYNYFCLIVCVVEFLLCVSPALSSDSNLCDDDDGTISFDATIYCESGFYWIERGEPEKAYGFFKQSISLYPDLKIAQQKLLELESTIKEKKRAKERRHAEEEKRHAEERVLAQKNWEAGKGKRAEKRRLERKLAESRRLAEEQVREKEAAKDRTCSQCQSDCAVNKHQFNQECYRACIWRYGVATHCMSWQAKMYVKNITNQNNFEK